MNNPLHDPVIRTNFFYALAFMGTLALPHDTPEEAERVRRDIRSKLHDCLLNIMEPALRRRLRLVAADLGIAEISTLFPAQPITETPMQETVDGGDLLNTLLQLTRGQLARLFQEMAKAASDPDGKFRRSDEVVAALRHAADDMQKLADKSTPGLYQAVKDADAAVRKVDKSA